MSKLHVTEGKLLSSVDTRFGRVRHDFFTQLDHFPGVITITVGLGHIFRPTAINGDATGKDDIFVGRIRQDESLQLQD